MGVGELKGRGRRGEGSGGLHIHVPTCIEEYWWDTCTFLCIDLYNVHVHVS